MDFQLDEGSGSKWFGSPVAKFIQGKATTTTTTKSVQRIEEGEEKNSRAKAGVFTGHILQATATGHCFIDWLLSQTVSPRAKSKLGL